MHTHTTHARNMHVHTRCTYDHARTMHALRTHAHTHTTQDAQDACTTHARRTHVHTMHIWHAYKTCDTHETRHTHTWRTTHTHTMHARHMRDAHTMHDVHTHTHDARTTLGHTIHGTSISTLNALMLYFFCSHHVVKFQDSPTYCVTYTLIYDIFYEKSSNYSLVLFTSYYEISKFTHLLANLNTYLCHIS